MYLALLLKVLSYLLKQISALVKKINAWQCIQKKTFVEEWKDLSW